MDEAALVDALRAGDEEAFAALLDRLDGPLRRLARTFVASAAAADDVVQETWLAVIEGIDRFEQRSSLRTWITRILMNKARTRGVREQALGPVLGPHRGRVHHLSLRGLPPARPPAVARPLGAQPAGVGRAARRTAGGGRDRGPGAGRHRVAAPAAPPGDHPARRGRLLPGRDLRGAGPDARQPAGRAPPGPAPGCEPRLAAYLEPAPR